jgi:hypothetical protein
MTQNRRAALVKAVATAVCVALAAWKGVDLDVDQLAEVLGFALAISQLVRRHGDLAPTKPGKDYPL